MTNGTDSASPMWSIPGYGFSIPVMDATGQSVTWADQTGGLTKRELFAAMAMQGMLAQSTESEIPATWTGKVDKVANFAVEHAEALLKRLSK